MTSPECAVCHDKDKTTDSLGRISALKEPWMADVLCAQDQQFRLHAGTYTSLRWLSSLDQLIKQLWSHRPPQLPHLLFLDLEDAMHERLLFFWRHEAVINTGRYP